jgi:hypothetical protein
MAMMNDAMKKMVNTMASTQKSGVIMLVRLVEKVIRYREYVCMYLKRRKKRRTQA